MVYNMQYPNGCVAFWLCYFSIFTHTRKGYPFCTGDYVILNDMCKIDCYHNKIQLRSNRVHEWTNRGVREKCSTLAEVMDAGIRYWKLTLLQRLKGWILLTYIHSYQSNISHYRMETFI